MPWTLWLLHFLYIFHICIVFHSFPSYTWFYSNKASHSESPERAPDHRVFLLLGHQQWACTPIEVLKASPVNTQNLGSCRDWSIWVIKLINQGICAGPAFYYSTPIWMRPLSLTLKNLDYLNLGTIDTEYCVWQQQRSMNCDNSL